MINNKEFWNIHYSGFKLQDPTPFAIFVHRKLQGKEVVLELGCGNGRDSLLLSSNVKSYIGFDSSPEAIFLATKNFSQMGQGKDNRQFVIFDFLEFNMYKEFKKLSNLLVYSRFSLHSITDAEEDLLFAQLKVLQAGTQIAVEVRTIHDPWFGIGESVGRNAFFSDHFRRFVVPSEIVEKFSKFCDITSVTLGSGLARYKEENPRVLRIEASII